MAMTTPEHGDDRAEEVWHWRTVIEAGPAIFQELELLSVDRLVIQNGFHVGQRTESDREGNIEVWMPQVSGAHHSSERDILCVGRYNPVLEPASSVTSFYEH